MGKKKTKAQKGSRNSASSTGPLIDRLLPKGLKGLQQSIFWKSSHTDKISAKPDDQASTGTLSSQGSAVNIASAANSGSTHNMLPPIILGAQTLNSDSAKSMTSSGYGSLPGSTRNSVIETTLPPVPGHSNIYGSDSDIVHKSSPDTSPLATKKYSISSYRRSREEPNGWMARGQHSTRHRMSVASTYTTSPRHSQTSTYPFTPMTITPLAHKQSKTYDSTSLAQISSQRTSRVVKISKYEYSLTSASGRTSIEVREPKMRSRKTSDLYSKKPPLTNRASITSLPPLDEQHRESNPRPQRNSYSFNSKALVEKDNNLHITASRLSMTSNNLSRRPSITSYAGDTGHRKSCYKISITSVDDGRVPACPATVVEEPVERPTSKRRYGTIMLESPRLSVIQKADDYPTFEKPVKAPAISSGRKDSLVVPAVPQIIFISPTPDPSNRMCSPSSSSTSPSEQQ